jgi:hypothetical protein
MKKIKLLSIVLLISLLLSAWSAPAWGAAAQQGQAGSPALAAAETGLKLIVDNKSGGELVLTLSGPRSYSFTAAKGKNVFYVEPGKYSYTYKACGANRDGSIVISGKGGKLPIAKCVMATVTMVNDTGGSFYLTITGTASYQLTIPTGKSKINVLKGKYEYRVSGSCGSTSGTINLRKGLVWKWWCY